MAKVFIFNGPNLNRLGVREPEIYGTLTLEEIQQACIHFGARNNFEIDFRQTNSESELVEWLQEAADTDSPVILNPAAFTHYSVAVRDAAALVKSTLIEVHISNPLKREEFRHTSLISGIAKGTVTGFGVNSYLLALQALISL